MDTKTRQKVTAILTLYCTKEGKAKNQLNNKICSSPVFSIARKTKTRCTFTKIPKYMHTHMHVY